MAPRLTPLIAIHMNPLEWPLWLLCTSITIGLLSFVALFAHARINAVEEERRRKEQQLQQGHEHGQFEVLWTFPEKEDKAARFKRWAEVLRFKPKEARPPIALNSARLDVKVALEVFYREAEAAGIASDAAAPRVADSDADSVAFSEDEMSAVLRERVKERILQFLMESGPPKGLCAITEEDRSVPSTPSSATRQHTIDMRKLMEYASDSNPSTPRSNRAPLVSPKAPPAMALDGEPVLRTETGEAVTRELLWAVLARIDREDSSASSAPSAPSAPSASASASAVQCGSDLKQPLLGEWKNPLQISASS